MKSMEYWIQKNLTQFEVGYITYKEYLLEKKSIMLSFKISCKKYNQIENNLI